MTDRVWHLMVTLGHEMRDDDVECVMQAIRMIKHVAKVEHVVDTYEHAMARNSAREEMRQDVYAALSRVMGWSGGD